MATDTHRYPAVHTGERRAARLVARNRTAEWKTGLRVVIYPISADASATSTRCVLELRKTAFDPIEAFFRTEGKKYSVSLGDPVEVFLAPTIPSRPPGTGIALAPESVLETVQHTAVARHALPKVHSDVVTPLIWRVSGQSPALAALRDLLAGRHQRKQRDRNHNKSLR